MKTVYLFTNTFPYGINSETFIEEEMRVAGNLGLHIVVLPLHRKKVCRCVPSNVEICNSLADTSFIKKIYIACLMLFSLHFWKMFIIRKSKFPQNPKRSVRFSGKRTKRSVQKRKARNTQKAETKVL